MFVVKKILPFPPQGYSPILQGNALVWQYGPMDGRPIDWSERWALGLVDAAVWLLLAACCWRYSRVLFGRARTISVSFLAVQAISLSILGLRAPMHELSGKIQIDERGKF